MTRTLKIAAAQYPLDELSSLAAYEAKIGRWVAEAAGEGAQLMVFPEFGALELAAIAGAAGDLMGCLGAVSELLPDADRILAKLAARHGVFIVGGSAPERGAEGRFFNVAKVFAPSGAMGRYEKIMPTPGERDPWRIVGGRRLFVFDIGVARVGLLICYDIEFPLLSRALAEAGAEVILAPSMTETEWGYWRVRTGAMARALENQVYTVQCPTVGDAPWCIGAPRNRGMAGVFAPSDAGFPVGGVMALGEMDRPQWLHATLDLDLLASVRQTGMVQTYNHWPEQPGAGPLPAATVVQLVRAKAIAAE